MSHTFRLTALALASAGAALACEPGPAPFDVLIRNGLLIDGTGRSAFPADVGLTGDRIAFVGTSPDARGRVDIDATGSVVAPGFIDIHAHVATAMQGGNAIEHFLCDGVTTVIDGNDGVSAWPVAETLGRLQSVGLSMNVGTFAGLNPVRRTVMETAKRPASDDDIRSMRALVHQALRDGAFGLTAGLEPALYHWPGYFTTADELVGILGPVAEANALFAPHIRDEAGGLMAAVNEAIDIATRAHVRMDFTHAKVVGTGGLPRAVDMVAAVDRARARGVDVAFDQFPYGDNGLDLRQLLPSWSFEEGRASLTGALKQPDKRRAIAAAVVAKIREHGGEHGNLYIRRCSGEPASVGKTLADVTRAAGRPADLHNQAETYLQLVAHEDCIIDEATIDEATIVTLLQSPLTAIASDGGTGAHPKAFGTRARILGRYVREQRLLSIEEAVRRMTSLPASRLGLGDRGSLRTSAFADLVIFQPDQIVDRATREKPTEMSTGVQHLIVNGRSSSRTAR